MPSSPSSPAAPSPIRRGPGVLLASGARAAEEALFAEVEAALAAGGAAALARPVRVIVPSRALRLHVADAVARRRGRAAAGLIVQTLYAAAMEVLERADVAPRISGRGGDLAFEVLVRRAARRQRALAERLETLVDGYGAAAATVRDLLDAGFEAAHAEAADEALAAARGGSGGRAGVPGDEVERARALVAAAVEVERDLARLGGERRSAVLRRATDLLAEDPERLPARAVLVHGFADATGLAIDFLEALVRRRAATAVVDLPPDPLAAGERDADNEADSAHGQRLRERLGGAAGLAPAPGPPPPAPAIDCFSAAGSDTEAREVARRARALLDGGARPEAIGVVARDLAPHRLALRRQLAALGVPFSGLGEPGALGAAGRRAQALLDLLRRGRDLPADRWLDAAGSLPLATGSGTSSGRRRRGPFVDLRLAFSSLGAGRLGDVAALDLDRVLGDRDWLALPILRGLAGGRREEEADDEVEEGREEAARPARRTVERKEIEIAVAAARRLVGRLADWPQRAPAGEHLRRLRGLVVQELGWRGGDRGEEAAPEPVLVALERLAADLPPGLDLDGEELRLILGRALDEAGRDALGGRGGGVQVLSVTEARGRTFDHLFVLGANRNSFPRPVRQDPLLGDDLRTALAAVLPDLPRKQAGFDEERHLFAELLSASPRVTISWWSRDDDGRAVALSPLVERLPEAAGAAVAATAHALAAGADPAADPGPRPAAESATLAALHGAGRGRVRELLATAIAEEAAETEDANTASPAALAAARVAILDEVDPDLRTPEGRATAAGLGPYFGFVGARTGGGDDPRRVDLWVTHAENLAACPWQLFLERLLRLEPTPDPLEALPGTDALLLGNVVHAVLEEIATAAGLEPGDTLAAALAREPVAVPWPAPEELERLTLAAARRVLLEEGVPLPGLARALAIQARGFLDRAEELDWRPAGGTLPVLAVEAVGEVTVEDDAGRRRRLSFKADRVDRAEGDGVRLTDYKTGRPLSAAKRASTLRDHHLRRVHEGRNLQATAYQLAGAAAEEAAGRGAPGEAPSEVVGRYVYLRPDADERTAEHAVGGGDPDFAARFAATVRAAFAAWDAGGFFPRVVDPAGEKEPVRCDFCRVAEACVRGDSGARRRLHRWASEAGAPPAAAERAVLAVWKLADPGAAEPSAAEQPGDDAESQA